MPSRVTSGSREVLRAPSCWLLSERCSREAVWPPLPHAIPLEAENILSPSGCPGELGTGRPWGSHAAPDSWPTPLGSGGAQEVAKLSWAWQSPSVLSVRPHSCPSCSSRPLPGYLGAGQAGRAALGQARGASDGEPLALGQTLSGGGAGLGSLVCRKITPTRPVGARVAQALGRCTNTPPTARPAGDPQGFHWLPHPWGN